MGKFNKTFQVDSNENGDFGFMWMCGVCPHKPIFSTVQDLFSHKRYHANKSEHSALDGDSDDSSNPTKLSFSNANNTLDPDDIPLSTLKINNISAKDQETTTNILPDLDDFEDIPLSNLKAKSARKSRKLKSKATVKGLSIYLEDNIPLLKFRNKPSDYENNPSSDIESNDISTSYSLETCSLKSSNDNISRKDNCSVHDDDLNNSVGNVSSSDSLDDTDFDVKVVTEKKKQNNTTKERRHVCKICNVEFPSRRVLSSHKNVHICQKTGAYKCKTCGKLCPKYDNFIRHLQIHEENRTRQFSCDRCSSSFYNMPDLKRHSVLHMEVKPFTCEYCNEGFTRQDSLLVHQGKHTGVQYIKYICKQCGKISNTPSALAMHLKNHTEKTIFCPELNCKFSCHLQSQLKQHLRKHSGEKPFQCNVCGRCFTRSNDMKNHILNVHERVRPFKCPYCPKEFTVPSALRSHRLTHLDVRPFLCAKCGKRFCDVSTLKKHALFIHREGYESYDCSSLRAGTKSKRRLKGVDKDEEREEEKPKTEVSFVNVGVQSIPVMTIPIHIPQVTVNLDQSITHAYIIPTVTLPSTQQIIKSEDS